MNKTVLFSNRPSEDNKNKIILIIVIVSIILFCSLLMFLYIYVVLRKKHPTANPLSLQSAPDPILEPTLWRNAITKDDINLEDIYQKETNKRLVVNPIAKCI